MASELWHVLANILNLVLCLAGLVMCVCRARFITPSNTKPQIRTLYRTEAFVFIAVLFAPAWTPVTGAQLILLGGNVFRLWHGRGAWLRGLPAYAVARS